MKNILNVKNIPAGSDGYVIIEWGGKAYEGNFLKSITATMSKEKEQVRVLGTSRTQHKTSGWEGTGEMTYYAVSSVFREMADHYLKTDEDVYFNMTIVLEDKSGKMGKQRTMLIDCNLDDQVLASLDAESAFLEEEASFTFTDYKILENFRNIF